MAKAAAKKHLIGPPLPFRGGGPDAETRILVVQEDDDVVRALTPQEVEDLQLAEQSVQREEQERLREEQERVAAESDVDQE